MHATARMTTALLIAALASSTASAETQRLINTRDMYPSPSPDGRQLVFQSNRSGSNQVYLVNISSADEEADRSVRQLTSFPLGAETPAIAPDGKRIVFAAYLGEDNNDVFVINSDGSGQVQLTNSPGYDDHPHWSHDGQRIVFNSDRSSPNRSAGWSDRWHEIYSMKADGSDVQQHTRCESVCTFGSLSPDGSQVLYRKVINGPAFDWGLNAHDRNSEVFIADLDGGNEINISNNAAFDGWPAWSPDGSTIAIASNRSGPANTGQVWLLNPDGSNPRQLTSGPWSHTQPAWSADSQSIYIYQHEETETHEFGSVVKISVEK